MNIEPHLSIENIHTIATCIWGLICFLMGTTLFMLNVPEDQQHKTYRSSVRILAANYLILSFLIFCMVLLHLRNSSDDVFPFPVLLISTSQGLIFPYALITLYVTKNVAKKYVFYNNVVPLVILVLLYSVSAVIFGDPVCNSIPHFFSQLFHPTVFIRFLLLLFNIYQIVFYLNLLQKLSDRYTKCIEQYYSDHVFLEPRCVKRNFYFAIAIGISAVFSNLFKDIVLDTIFTASFSVFYFMFAILYMQYKSIFTKHEPEFIDEMESCDQDEQLIAADKPTETAEWSKIRKSIVDQQLYLRQGITVKEICGLFHTNRTTFSSMLNRNERQNFGSFINRLRIEHAKQLLIENPEMTIIDISQQCGFSEQSNFTRQFKLECNQTPAVWAKKQRKYVKT